MLASGLPPRTVQLCIHCQHNPAGFWVCRTSDKAVRRPWCLACCAGLDRGRYQVIPFDDARAVGPRRRSEHHVRTRAARRPPGRRGRRPVLGLRAVFAGRTPAGVGGTNQPPPALWAQTRHRRRTPS